MFGLPYERGAFALPYERGVADILGAVLRLLIVGRLELPAGGRGTDRAPGELEGGIDLAPVAAEGPENGLALLCGGRGTLWFRAICGALRLAAGLPRPRLDIVAELELPRLCGGRGTLRPAGCGSDRALLSCPP